MPRLPGIPSSPILCLVQSPPSTPLLVFDVCACAITSWGQVFVFVFFNYLQMKFGLSVDTGMK